MVSAKINWQIPPEVLAGNIKEWADRLRQAVLELGDRFAGLIQSWMQANAPWTDRTSNARQGLKAMAEAAGNEVTIYLMHTVEYGIYLEMGTSKMGARPIILPALEAFIGQITAALEALIG